MSTKRLKFLKRAKIRQQDVRVRLEVHGPAKRFKADLDLGEYEFPPNARVVVEAKQLLETIRFDFGTVGAPRVGVFHDISRLKGERVIFNVLVLDPVTARKLGSATTIRPNVEAEKAEESIPLLPVDASSQVSPLVWEIEYTDHDQEGHTDAPVLKVDAEAARHSAAFFMQDAAVRAMVLPAAMREVLTRVLLVDRSEYEPDSRDWRSSWIRFGARLAGEEPPAVNEGALAVEEAAAWIGKATKALAGNAELLKAYLRERSE